MNISITQRPFDAIIFDHDGTLVDTESADQRACQMLYHELGMPFNHDRWASLVAGSIGGYTVLFTELIQEYGDGLTHDKLWQRLRELWQITYAQVELAPGVTQLLPCLQSAGYPLAVASSSNRPWLERWLTHFDLRTYFQVIASSNDVTSVKPAPDVYLFAADRLGVQPEHCLVFEDTLIGMQAAWSAGMTVVAVPSAITCRLDFCHAHAVIDSLANVTPAWLAELAKRQSFGCDKPAKNSY